MSDQLPPELNSPDVDAPRGGRAVKLNDAAISLVEAEVLFRPFASQRILLAVSGGPDSMAMMHLASMVANSLHLSLSVATVDHGLRTQSAADAAFVAAKAQEMGLASSILEWRGVKPVAGIQELAREARYDLLVAEVERTGATHLMTAHTLDDQAETILFRMARGSGLSGLVGMRPIVRRAGIVHARPLLGMPKRRLIKTCRARSIDYLEDRSNSDPSFARARWRALLPALAEEGLTSARLQQLSRRLARADAALNARADVVIAAAAGKGATADSHDARMIAAEPIEIVIRVIARLIEGRKADDAFSHVPLSRLEALAEALQAAICSGQPLRRTLAGLIIGHDRGILKIEPAAPRRSRKAVLL